MFFSDKGYQCTMNTNALSHQLSWSYGDIYNITKSKSMFSPSWGTYILRMSVFYCNSESNLMATYTKSKLCSLVIKVPMHYEYECQCIITPVILKWWHIQHTKSKSMFSPSWGAYILRMSVFYCNSESNLMVTYTMSKLCSLVIKDTNALWIPMHYHTSYPEVMVTYTTLQSQNLCSALVEVHTYYECLCFIVTLSPTLWRHIQSQSHVL